MIDFIVKESGEFMTAQTGDKFVFRGEDYSIVAISSPINFYPQNYGIKPRAFCTGCWKGYWCEYYISDKDIKLENLYINSQNGNYPEIRGIKPEKDGEKDFLYMGYHLYKNLGMPVDYTGKIIVGKGFINKYYIHMGYQRAWAYEVLKELIFANGIFVESIDHSEMARKLRSELDEKAEENEKERCDIPLFVSKSFSLEMKDKAWWIK